MEFQREFGVLTAIRFVMLKAGSQSFAVAADWTPATGDVKVSLDGGNFANALNLPTIVGGTGAIFWTLTLQAAETLAEQIDIQIVDSATKAVEDNAFVVSTRLGSMITASRGVYTIVCDDATFTPTTTVAEFTMRAPHLTEEVTADHFNGRLLTGTTGVTQGIQTDITDYELANSKLKLTYSAITDAPVTGSVWTIQ